MEGGLNSAQPSKASLLTIIISCTLSTFIAIFVANSPSFSSIFKDLKFAYRGIFGDGRKPIPSGLISLLDNQKYSALVPFEQGKNFNVIRERTEIERKETDVGRTGISHLQFTIILALLPCLS